MIALIFLVALFGIFTADNLLRKLMCLNIAESMIVLSFLSGGFYQGRFAPIISDNVHLYVDPLPQALMLTAIVINVCFNCLAAILIVRFHERTGKVNISEIVNYEHID